MREMIEIVALAINKAGMDWLNENDPKRMQFEWADIPDEVFAHAAIEAMRIPTEEMRHRYNDPDVVGYGPDGSDHDKVWEAGIDAALKEQTK